MVFAGCLSPDGAGAQSLKRQSSDNLKILKLDVTRDEDVQQAKRTVQENLPEKGESLSTQFCKKEKENLILQHDVAFFFKDRFNL